VSVSQTKEKLIEFLRGNLGTISFIYKPLAISEIENQGRLFSSFYSFRKHPRFSVFSVRVENLWILIRVSVMAGAVVYVV